MFVAKLDGAGNYLWVAQAGGGQQDIGGDVGVDANGAVYVTGTFLQPGGHLWRRSLWLLPTAAIRPW